MRTLIYLAVLAVSGVDAEFSANGQAAILNVHNTLRSNIAKGSFVAKGLTKPAGTNILKMSWDAELATSAQAHADKCSFAHSDSANLGENLYVYATSANIASIDQYGSAASAMWEREFQDYGWKSNFLGVDLSKSGILHATQMAWAKTDSIGCGVKNCAKTINNAYNTVIVVCQYKAQGNILNQNIYTPGATCSACPSGTTCEKETGLCI